MGPSSSLDVAEKHIHYFTGSITLCGSCLSHGARGRRVGQACSTPSSHLRLGLLAILVPSGLEKCSFLHGDVSFDLVRCPSHLNHPSLIVFIISGALYRWWTASVV
jgi:hypothetical protein